jgi:hypothetical protein
VAYFGELTPWSTVLLKELSVPQSNSPLSMVCESSLPCSQEQAIGPYPQPDEPSPHINILFL